MKKYASGCFLSFQTCSRAVGSDAAAWKPQHRGLLCRVLASWFCSRAKVVLPITLRLRHRLPLREDHWLHTRCSHLVGGALSHVCSSVLFCVQEGGCSSCTGCSFLGSCVCWVARKSGLSVCHFLWDPGVFLLRLCWILLGHRMCFTASFSGALCKWGCSGTSVARWL